jgi:hypothetical protein
MAAVALLAGGPPAQAAPSTIRTGGPTSLKILRQQRLRFRKGPFDGPAGAYEDRVAHYVTSEVALDYAASTVLLLAALAPPPA